MSDESNKLRAIAWREVFPWLLLARSFGLAIRVSILALATLGVLLTPLGWWLGATLFLPDEIRSAMQNAEMAEATGSGFVGYQLPTELGALADSAIAQGRLAVVRWLAGWRHFLELPLTLTMFAYLTFGGLWTLAVWALFGGAITRIAVAEMGREERISLVRALRHVGRRYMSYLGAPLLPLAGIVFGLALLALLGLIMRSNFGVLVAGLVWIFVLLGCFVLAVLFIGLALGWPLMWVALGAELDGDAFEAVSRGYTYAFQRPLRYLWYFLVALVLGALGWLLVYHFSEILLGFARQTVLWSAGAERHPDLVPWFVDGAAVENDSRLLAVGGWLIEALNRLVRVVATSYGFSFFFCAAAALYLLLRRSIDEQEFDDVFSDEEQDALQLPPVPRSLAPAAAESQLPTEPESVDRSAPSAEDLPDANP